VRTGERFETKDALRIIGMKPASFRMAMEKRGYPAAPPVTGYNRRDWDGDDLLCLTWFDAMVKQGAPRSLAGQLAAHLREALRSDPRAKKLRVYQWQSGATEGRMRIAREPPAEHPNAAVLMEIPIDHWRANVATCVANFYQREAGRHGSNRPS
jgi:hypothetical protein